MATKTVELSSAPLSKNPDEVVYVAAIRADGKLIRARQEDIAPGKVSTQQLNEAISDKADKSELEPFLRLTDGELALNGRLLLQGDATLDAMPVTLRQLLASTRNLGCLADFATTPVPVVVKSISVNGFNVDGDGGASGPWVRVASEPAHPGKIKDKLGGWFELQANEITPRMFGAFGNGTDQTAQITNLFAYCYAKYRGASGDQYPTGPQPVIQWGAGRFRAPDLIWESNKTSVVMQGLNGCTLLDGISIHSAGFRQTIFDIEIMDSRGVMVNRYGYKMVGASARARTADRIRIRDKHVGFWNAEGAASVLGELKIEKCTIGLLSSGPGSGDTIFTAFYITSCDIGHYNRGTGEIKFNGGFITGNKVNVMLEGDPRIQTLECYYSNSTFTNVTVQRDFPVKRVVANGDNKARVILAENVPVQSSVNYPGSAGTRFSRGHAARLAEAMFIISSTSGSMTSLRVNGALDLIAAPVPWTSAAAGATAVAAAINAMTPTTGYTAVVSGNVNIYVIPPGLFDGTAQNGMTLTWTLGSGSAVSRPAVLVTTSQPHGLAVGDPAEFNDGTDMFGIATVAWVESDTSFVISGKIANFCGGSYVTKALRIFDNATGCSSFGFTTITGYNLSALNPLAVGPGWIDMGLSVSGIPVNFAGNDATGTVRLPGWGMIMLAHDQSGTLNDHQMGASSNFNWALLIGAFHTPMIGQRTKENLWVEPSAFSDQQAHVVEKIGVGFGRRSTNNRWAMPTGAWMGWGFTGYIDESGSFVPGAGGPGVAAPHAPHRGKSGRAKTLNVAMLMPDHYLIRVGGIAARIKQGGLNMATLALSDLTTTYPAASWDGYTFRLAGRPGVLVTAEGGVWYDSLGGIVA